MGRTRAAGVDRRSAEELSEAIIRLTRATQAIRAQIASRAQDGIDWAAYGLLFQLVQDGPRRSSALAEAACVDPSTVSRQVSELVAAGLVERRSDPEDGRAVLLVATEAGHALYAAKRDRRVAIAERIVDGWPADDVTQLTELLGRLTDSITALRPQFLAELADVRPERTA